MQAGLKRAQGHIAKLCAKGEFKQCVKKGKTWLIHKNEVEAYKIQCLPQAMRKNKKCKKTKKVIRVAVVDSFCEQPEPEKKTA